jgi:uncharacterized membrane protein YidH (DUF202 family)
MVTTPDPSEPGLAQERTVLAWNRSGLAVVVCIAVLLRHVWPLRGTDQDLALALIAAAVVAWAVVLALFTHSASRWGAVMPHRARIFRVMTGATLLLALVGFVAAFSVA